MAIDKDELLHYLKEHLAVETDVHEDHSGGKWLTTKLLWVTDDPASPTYQESFTISESMALLS